MEIISPSEKSKAKTSPVAIRNVKIKGFFNSYLERNRKVSIPSLYRLFKKYGTIENFEIVAGIKKGKITRRLATDSDLYKWMEAVSWDLQNFYNEENVKLLDKIIDLIGKVQEKDGYIDTYYTGKYKKLRFKELYRSHELYCGGHLIQAAIAHYRSTRRENFLNIAIKWADYICRKFGKGKIEENDGHPEVEMALVELYRTTGKEKYLKLADFFMNLPYHWWGKFPDKNFLEFKEVMGHAVRIMYLLSGATDYYTETGDERYLKGIKKLWKDISERKVYITGGIGSRYEGEAIGLPYELPNLRSYCESCASVALMMWIFRLFLIEQKAEYFDLFETTLYNSFLSSISLDGKNYFYVNPLASYGDHTRKSWYTTTCCPPNIQRFFSSLPGYFYTIEKNGIYINLYDTNESEIKLNSGNKIKIIQKTDYPFSGKISFDIKGEKEGSFNIYLRIPLWAENPELKIGNKRIKLESGKYFKLEVKKEIKFELDLNLRAKFYLSNPQIESTRNCYAIKRGPLVYCLESIDNKDIDIFNSFLFKQRLKEKYEKFLNQRIITIEGNLYTLEKNSPLYYPETRLNFKYRKTKFKAIPYYLWANRGKSQMIIWVPISP